MLTIGLTGNIAAGKSTVAQVWRELGARVVDADVLARRAVEPGSPALAEIVAEWGGAALDASGGLDREAMRSRVFADPSARARLESIVHPEVRRLRDLEISRAETAGERMIVADIPLLFETGMEDEFDRVVLVDAPEPERLRRLVEDRGLPEEDARRIISAQMPSARKRPRADFVIENDATREALRTRAAEVWTALVRMGEGASGG